MLTGIITMLLFSLLATYDYIYSYDRSTKPISYDRREYLEFYLQAADRSAVDDGLEVTEGVPFSVFACLMNLLGAKRSLTLEFGPSPGGTGGVLINDVSQEMALGNSTYRYEFTIDDGEYREFALRLVPGPGLASLRVAILDGNTALAVREFQMR